MNKIQNTAFINFAALAILVLGGCNKAEPQASPGNSAGAAPAAVATATKPAASNNPPPLASNERLQGTIELNAGQGTVVLRSLATTLDANLGKQVAERMNTAEGQQQVAKGNESVKAITGSAGTAPDIASTVQSMANSFAGKTIYTSQMQHVKVINSHIVSLEAKLPKGPGITLDLGLSDKDYKLESAKISYYPDSKNLFESFDSKESGPDAAIVTIDKFERVNDTTYAIEGSYKAANLKPSVLAKKLEGQSIALVEGRFKFAELAVRAKL